MYLLVENGDALIRQAGFTLKKKLSKGKVIKQLPDVCQIEAVKGNILPAKWKHASYDWQEGAIRVPIEDKLQLLWQEQIPGELAKRNTTGLLVFDFEAEALPQSVMLLAECDSVIRCALCPESGSIGACDKREKCWKAFVETVSV